MLKLGGYINLFISLLHFAALFCLWDAFRITGVYEIMERLAAVREYLPAVSTVFVAVIFAVFGLYALVAAGALRLKLPLLRLGIYGIGAIYTLRGISGLIMDHSDILQVLFSLTALWIGILYLAGGWSAFNGPK
ncbi:MAG: hypothetical protein LUF87_00925 [Alistipes sp.]|nr:hypothetical protein [Alistipes sp.]